MHFVYILYSESRDRYYIGQSANVLERVRKHNSGYSKSTKSGIPWKLRKVVKFESKKEAIRAENWLKKMKSRKVTENVLSGELNLADVI